MSSQKPSPPEKLPDNVIPFPRRKKKFPVFKVACGVLIVFAIVADIGIGIYLFTKLF